MKIQEVTAGIQKNIDREQVGIDVFNHLVKVFQPYDGRKISQRMITAVNKNLPKGFNRANLSRIASLIQVILIPDKYEDKLTFLLGYQASSGKTNTEIFAIGSAEVEYSGFAYYNARHGFFALERNVQRRKLQKRAIYLAGLANTYKIAKKAVEDVKAELSDSVNFTMHSEMTKLLGMKENLESY